MLHACGFVVQITCAAFNLHL